MDDNEPKPMTDADAAPPPADTSFEPSTPIKNAGVTFDPAPIDPAPKAVADAAQQAKDGARGLSRQAGDKALMFADQGKERATGALDQLSGMLTDAAAQVDEKLGASYGDYARTAASTVQDFAEQLRAKSVDDLLDDARTLVRKSPGAAIGAAATVGFVVARLVSAGLDQRDA